MSQIRVLAGPRQFWGENSTLKSPFYPHSVLIAALGDTHIPPEMCLQCVYTTVTTVSTTKSEPS